MTHGGDQRPPADRARPRRRPADAAQQAWEEGRRLGVEKALEG